MSLFTAFVSTFCSSLHPCQPGDHPSISCRKQLSFRLLALTLETIPFSSLSLDTIYPPTLPPVWEPLLPPQYPSLETILPSSPLSGKQSSQPEGHPYSPWSYSGLLMKVENALNGEELCRVHQVYEVMLTVGHPDRMLLYSLGECF